MSATGKPASIKQAERALVYWMRVAIRGVNCAGLCCYCLRRPGVSRYGGRLYYEWPSLLGTRSTLVRWSCAQPGGVTDRST
ncbi:hypothetical protein CERSUDRAFT_116680, partial [Gelatoporia subvermispora B]